MNVSSADVMRKCNTVVTRLQQLLRFVVITDQPIVTSGSGVVFFMLVALTATSVFIAFNFDF